MPHATLFQQYPTLGQSIHGRACGSPLDEFDMSGTFLRLSLTALHLVSIKLVFKYNDDEFL